jgi:hypothetical protein
MRGREKEREWVSEYARYGAEEKETLELYFEPTCLDLISCHLSLSFSIPA